MTGSMAPFQSEEHYSRVWRKLVTFFARRAPSEAEDLAAKVVERLVASTAKNGPPNDTDTFALGIAKHVYHEFLRQAARFPPAETKEISGPAPPPGADNARTVAVIAVRALSPGQRELLEQYYLDKETAGVLAEKLGLTAPGVRSYVWRLRRRLLAYMAEAKGAGG